MSGRSVFTFHHVSIKTRVLQKIKTLLLAFTFHHVSIKTCSTMSFCSTSTDSHSTMYLLKLNIYNSRFAPWKDSHSTMYLLKPVADSVSEPVRVWFTFHHVSIKTKKALDELDEENEFTFHHVSIKTQITGSLYCVNKFIHIPPCIY